MFCNEGVDDICHYFYDCSVCDNFWINVRNWIGNNFEDPNEVEYINRKNVILGLNTSLLNSYSTNVVLLYAKWFIYKKKKGPILKLFLCVLQSLYTY